jgi:hypothetical protein
MSTPRKPADKALFLRTQQMSRQASVVTAYCRNTGLSSKSSYRLLIAAMSFRGGIRQFNSTYEDFGAHMLGRDRSPAAWKSAVSRDVQTHSAEREKSGYPGIRIIPGSREIDRRTGEVISATPASWDIEAFPHLVKMLEIARGLEKQNRRKTRDQRSKREEIYDEAFRQANIPYEAPESVKTESAETADELSDNEEAERMEGVKLAIQRVGAYARRTRIMLLKEADRQTRAGIQSEIEAVEHATRELLKANIDRIFDLPPEHLKRKLSEDEIPVAPISPVNKDSRTSVADELGPQKAESGIENATGNSGFSSENEGFSVPSGDKLDEANAALTVLSSLGVEKINVLLSDDALHEALKAKYDQLRARGYSPSQIKAKGIDLQTAVQARVTTITKLRSELAALLAECEREKRSFIVDPRPSLGGRLIQVDEASNENREFLAPLAAYSIETSDDNNQVLIVLAEGTSDKECDETEDRLFSVLKPLGCNKGSSGASRWPGSYNFKPKRRRADGSYPLVRLHTHNIGRTVTQEELKDLGLQPEPEKPKRKDLSRRLTKLPREFVSYDYSLASVDRSRADWKFTCQNKVAGWTAEHIEAELRNISDKAQERERHGSNKYVGKTVSKVFNRADSPRVVPMRTRGSL